MRETEIDALSRQVQELDVRIRHTPHLEIDARLAVLTELNKGGSAEASLTHDDSICRHYRVYTRMTGQLCFQQQSRKGSGMPGS